MQAEELKPKKDMKRHLFILAMLLLPMMTSAEEVEIDGLWYNLVSKAKVAEVIQYKNNQKYSGDIVIPETVTYEDIEYGVTSIGEKAFYDCTNLLSINIGNSVTSVGQYAFYGCESLTSATIPNSVTTIGIFGFYRCI